ncbi:MAG: T9SS type A sorting domain-containing protein [Flavobacteriales bacterium]
MIQKIYSTLFLTILLSSFSYSQIDRPIGSNQTGIVDWSTESVFTNSISQAREWISHEYGSGVPWSSNIQIPLRSDGYPIEIPYTSSLHPPQAIRTLMHFGETSGLYPGGNYLLKVSGEGQIRLWGAASGTFQCPVDTLVYVDSSMGGIALEIDTSKISNPIHNIQFIQPKYQSNYQNKLFTDELLDFVKDFQTIRFMDWMSTNDNPNTTWNTRNTTDYCFQTLGKGVAYEHLIELCNQTNKNAWICIPHQADNNFITQFARLMRDSLNPGLKVYVEYSNEVWNSIFAQTRYADSMGNVLGYSGSPWVQGWKFYAKRCADVFEIFDNEFSDSTRIVKVIAAQAANSWVQNYILERFSETTYNPTQVKADALAIAPYFGGVADEIGNAGLAATITVSAIVDSMEAALPETYKWMREAKVVADTHRIDLIAYEGGQHLVAGYLYHNDTSYVNKLINANRHPKMQTLYCEYFDYWYDSVGGGLFCNFSSHSFPSKYGSWGVKEFQNDTNNPKYLALKNCVFPQNTSPVSLIEYEREDVQFKIYPNPTNNILNIEGSEKIINYRLFNTVGKVVKSGDLISNQIDCSQLPNGIYLLSIQDLNKKIGVRRVIISK